MAATKRVKEPSLPFRRAAPTRRGQRPAIVLDGLDGHLGYFVRRLQIWIFQDFIRTLASIDISPAQFSVLTVIGSNRGLSQIEISAALGIERARLVRLLHRLESRALIRRLPSSADGRRHALQLTPHGRTLLARARTLAARHEKRLMEKLGAERHQMMLEALGDFQR
jgi:DNA-binding MarR family transcriptional regulator